MADHFRRDSDIQPARSERRHARPERDGGRRGSLRSVAEWVGAVLIAFALFGIIRIFLIEPFTVPTGSMEPTIQVGDNILAQKITSWLGLSPSQGDVIVFHNPDVSSDHKLLVKRVVATAGQTVDYEDGYLYVDGERVEEPYAAGESEELPYTAPGAHVSFPYTVPDGCVWVMGDNRENSLDSRYFGPIDVDDVIGVALLRYWPLDRIGAL